MKNCNSFTKRFLECANCWYPTTSEHTGWKSLEELYNFTNVLMVFMIEGFFSPLNFQVWKRKQNINSPGTACFLMEIWLLHSATRNIKISLYQQSFPVLHKLHFFYMKWIKAPSTSVIKELWQIHVNGGRIFCSWRVNIISHRHLLRYDRVLCQLRCCGVL